ncbi:MAG: acetyl-CoA decarbonylase/synthase complex subunit delta [Proteobacteria bacterium]|nr:acetyl-CoA decarbonylase/synthase complex subunit delta [Pseudomonadota bacterium]MBU1388590.1 acetyl-CoA decarbonylase/synthase complex subunit delta [Pseudomonadota bacterium]MBU1541746.1 acetyl-CoA decarbonylase/synthase complex subunit delta [Pseudomonadota bacterium]MBU2482354.1 acetyl-CoA decarbonylase/synthase complex subunit delta [Pseudomonadota bacterium]
MGFEITKEKYAGSIKGITIGKGDNALTVGGQTSYPFYQFEGKMPNKPVIAMEIWDIVPEDWPEAALAPFKDVVSDPAAWAKKCVEVYNAQAIVLQLKSIDPNDKNASAEDAAKTVKKVLAAVKVPVIVWGCAVPAKDEEVLKKVCEVCDGDQLVIGPVEEKNHKGIGAAAMGYGHTVISSSPIDVNLAKQVNILLENLGVSLNKVIVDPTTGGLGYGLEYSYSVMERLTQAAMSQGDDKLQNPMINNLGNEVWKCKEAKQTVADAPELGDPERRAILMEAVGAVSYLMSGSSILIMRHPEAIKLAKAFINLISDGGSAMDVAPIAKQLDDVEIDFAALSPAPDLTIEEEKKKEAPAKKAAPAKKEAPKAEAKPAAKTEAAPAAKAAAPAAPAAPAADPAAEAKAKADADAKAKADADAKAAADAAAKVKAAADAKAKAEADAKAAVEAEKQAAKDAAAKREADELALREKRAAEKAKHATKSDETQKTIVSMTAAKVQKSMLDKIIENLDRIHKRVS